MVSKRFASLYTRSRYRRGPKAPASLNQIFGQLSRYYAVWTIAGVGFHVIGALWDGISVGEMIGDAAIRASHRMYKLTEPSRVFAAEPEPDA